MGQPSQQKRSASWPGDNDRDIVRQMLEDPLSPHWQHCRDFVMYQVRKLKVPVDHQDDVVQDIMLTVARNLHSFQHNCKLTTWLTRVARWRVTDRGRQDTRNPLQPLPEESEGEGEKKQFPALRTVEEECIDRENLREAVEKIQRHALTRDDPQRCRQVLKKALFEGKSVKEVAEELGIEMHTVHYIIRIARNYLHDG